MLRNTCTRFLNCLAIHGKSCVWCSAGETHAELGEHQQAEVQAIGAAAVNQVIKALILANEYLQGDGIHVGFVPEWAAVMIVDERRDAIKFVIIILA